MDTAIQHMSRPSDESLEVLILRMVRDHNDFTEGRWGPDTVQLAAWIDRPYMTVKKYVDRFVQSGQLQMGDGKRWLLITPTGRRELVLRDSRN